MVRSCMAFKHFETRMPQANGRSTLRPASYSGIIYVFVHRLAFSSACTQQPPAWACCRPPVEIVSMLAKHKLELKIVGKSYIILIALVLIILILAGILIILVVLIVELGVLEVLLIELLEGKGLTSEPVDGTGDELLLDILTELVIELKTLLDIGGGGLVVISRGLRGGEEVEERLGRNGLLDNAGLLGGCAVC